MPPLRLAATVAAVIACAVATLPATAQQAAPDHVAVGALRFVSSGPLFVAVENGYLHGDGVDAELKFFDAAQPIAVAVVSGDIDIGVTALTAGMFNLAGRGGIKIIAAQAREKRGFEGNAVLASNAAWERGLRRLEDLPDHSFGTTQVGSSFHYQIGQIARLKGFALDSIELKPLQSLSNMAAALKTGQVDAIIIAPHLAKAMLAAGDAKLLAWYSDLDEYQFGAVFASSRIVMDHRATVERFVRAYQKGTAEFAAALLQLDAAGKRSFDHAKSDPIAALVGKYVYPSDPPAAAIEKVVAATYYVDPHARLDVADIARQIAWYKAHGLVDAAVDGGKFIDLSFVGQSDDR